MATTTTTTTVVTTADESGPQPFGAAGTVGQRARWLAASLSLVAAGIHFGFAPGHWAEDWRHGAFFLALGWFQVLFAVAVVARPTRAILGSAVVVSVGTLIVWGVSRTAGLPDFLGGGGQEPVALADLVASAAEAVIVVFCAALLTSSAWSSQRVAAPRLSYGVSAAVVAAALLAGSLSLTPSFTAAHDHGSEHDHGAHDQGVLDGAVVETASVDGHDHSSVAETSDAHDHGSADGADTTAAAPHSAGPYAAGGSPCEQAKEAFPSDDGEDSDPTAGHNHSGALVQEPIDDATRQQLIEDQKQARTAVDRYPTVADATADGYRLSTVYLPCIGAHYTKVSLVGEFNAATPSELLYDGTDPDSPIIGLSYLLVHPGGPPEGFAGPNDVWHQHSSNGGLCLNPAGVVIGAETMSKATCEQRGGRKSGLKDIWMVHDWVAPGWDCSWGVFAAECPELGGKPGGTSKSPLA